ncbi:MAG: T9SS type A sorting domain-containing protein [Bacteroidaceae bacterium]|nr:T9SS type A sorting domain-containing protein [Bacteroidaceae bacterium]
MQNTQKVMIKRLQILVLSLLIAGAPVSLMAQVERDEIETELSAVSLSANGAKVHVSGAEGQTLEVYNLTGVKVTTIRIDSNDKALTLNLQRGCYILKVGKVVRKISIR